MTEVFVDGLWQSVSEKTHPQTIPAREPTALRWIDGNGNQRRALRVLEDGVQGVGYAFRIRTPLANVTVEFRVERYDVNGNPIDGDNGTFWIGPLPVAIGAWYYASLHDDHKGGHVGMGYGTTIRTSRAVKVDQFKMTLIPRVVPVRYR